MDIYENPRAWRVRVAQAAVFGFGVVIVWLAFFSGDPVSSTGEQIFVWVMGALVAAVMVGAPFYLRAYVVRISSDWRVTTLDLLGQRTIVVDPSQISLGAERHDFAVYRSIVNNFWAPLRVPGEPFPLILDTTPPARFDEAQFTRGLSARK